MTERARLSVDNVTLPAGWSLEVVDEIESTNTGVAGRPPGSVLAAELQTAGRGRLDRTWTSPAGAGLTFSVLLQTAVAPARRTWLPLLAGVAVAEAVPGSSLKWPNDVLLDGRKLAGILATSAGADVVLGIGVNVSTTPEELPVPTATSLAIEGGETDRAVLLSAILAALDRWFTAWTAAEGDAEVCGLAAVYRERCATIGQDVLVTGAAERSGVASTIDANGSLVVDGLAVSAGDVTHVRPATH